MELPTVPCETCSEPTTYTGTKRCNGCWEVERRIQDYIRHPNGRKFLLQSLDTIDVAPLKRWIGKERARFVRIYENPSNAASKERAFGEANVCELITTKINKMLREQKKDG